MIRPVSLCLFPTTAVQKSKNPEAEAAKKKAELEKRLEDVSGKLGNKTAKHKSSKGRNSPLHIYRLALVLTKCFCVLVPGVSTPLSGMPESRSSRLSASSSSSSSDDSDDSSSSGSGSSTSSSSDSEQGRR